MLRRSRSRRLARRQSPALLFAALGDKTRLALVAQLCGGGARSIAQLSAGSALTRQAITKHLRVLESVDVVHSVRAGREQLFEFNPGPVNEIRKYLEAVSEQRDRRWRG